jgi:hypothetical protein
MDWKNLSKDEKNKLTHAASSLQATVPTVTLLSH